MSFSAQNSITIRRLRNGDTLFLTLAVNDVGLYQGIDTTSGAVIPDWTKPNNQPEITPKVATSRGNSAYLSMFSWKYNGVELLFSGTQTGSWKNDSTNKFQLNTTTGAIKIIANLASVINVANDSLIFAAIATVAGVEYNISKSIDVQIQSAGASSYYGVLTASTEQLTAEVTETNLSTKLFIGVSEIPTYYVKWYKDNVLWTDKNGQKIITIESNDVDGTQLFIAEFSKSASEPAVLFRSAIRIIDSADDFQVVCSISSDNKEVDTGKPVTVTAKIVNMRTSAIVTGDSEIWQMDVMDKDNWVSLKSSSTNSIVVTTAETDRNGKQQDVDVMAEVTWSSVSEVLPPDEL